MKDVFFTETQHAIDNLTEVFDLIHPILASLWHMKSEIMGLKLLYPGITETKLKSRYSLTPDTRGVNYTQSFLAWEWDKITGSLAWILLNNTLAVYDGWLEELRTNVFNDMSRKLNIQAMQFPKMSGNIGENMLDEISTLTQTESILLRDTFYIMYRSRNRRAKVPLNNLMYCYRFFKVYRNCYTHNGGVASSSLITAYNEFLPYSSAVELGVKEWPEFDPPVLGQKLVANLRSVIGFSYIVMQIILTCDAELLRSHLAEKQFLSRLKDMDRVIRSVHRDNNGAGRAKTFVHSAGYLKPDNGCALRDYLFREGLFHV